MFSQFIPALRRIARSPGFALAVVTLVGLAVFVNATAFGTLYTLRWKALPFAEGERLVVPEANLESFGVVTGLTVTLRERLLAQPNVFDAVAGYTAARPQREQETRADWRISRITPDLLPMLGAHPALGRVPAPDEVDAVVVSHAAWQGPLAADPAVLERRLRIAGRTLRVVGVMDAGFAFPDRRTDAWTPYVPSPAEQSASQNGNVGDLNVVARLSPGVTPAQARDALGALFDAEPSLAGLRSQAGLTAVLTPLRESYAAQSHGALGALTVAAVLLLVVAAFNLGSLLLERVAQRERELAVRRALGASRRELLLAAAGDLSALTALGALGGLATLPFGVALLQHMSVLPPELPLTVALDPVIVGSGLLLGLLLVAGALAVGALGSVRRIASAGLNTQATARGLGRVRGGLLIGQLALTTMLIGGAILLLRSTANLLAEDTGFDRRQVLLADIDIEADPGSRDEDRAATARAVREALRAMPGVSAVAQVNLVPFSGSESVNGSSWDDGEPPRRSRSRVISPGYFEAMGVPLRGGRGFLDSDLSDPGAVVVVDELFVDRYLQGRDPLTASVRMATDQQGGSRQARVIGVARTVRHTRLDESIELPTVYEIGTDPLRMSWYVIRAEFDPAALAPAVRAEVERRFPGARVAALLPLGEMVARSVRQRQAIASAVTVFGGATLALAVLGLYAALAFAFRRRRQELAVRLALGARHRQVVSMVLGQGLLLAALSLPFGIAFGVLLAFQQAPLLYQLRPGDPATWALAAVIIALATALAALPSALRAARVSPHAALRVE